MFITVFPFLLSTGVSFVNSYKKVPLILTRNPYSCRMWLNLSKIFARLSHDPNVRVIFITSSGDRAFSSGLDVQVRSAALYHSLSATCA